MAGLYTTNWHCQLKAPTILVFSGSFSFSLFVTEQFDCICHQFQQEKKKNNTYGKNRERSRHKRRACFKSEGYCTLGVYINQINMATVHKSLIPHIQKYKV